MKNRTSEPTSPFAWPGATVDLLIAMQSWLAKNWEARLSSPIFSQILVEIPVISEEALPEESPEAE